MIDLPKSWRIKKLKYLFKYSLSSVDRHVHDEELNVHICHYPDVYYNENLNSVESLPTGTCTPNELEKFQVLSGDILITKDSVSHKEIGIPCLISANLENTVCGYHLGIIRRQSEIDPEYVFRFLQTDYAKGYFYCESLGVTRFGLGKPAVENLKLPIPPLEEQRLIARYLDKRTGQIDALTDKIQKKIELLKKERISLINQCVTKGLNPNVSMKDSGIEWIGGIPEHWKMKKLKYLFNYSLSSIDRHVHDEEISIYICHYPDVYYNEKIDSVESLPIGTCTPDELEKFQVLSGDILITKDSESPEDIGVPCLISGSLENTVCGYHLGIIRRQPEMNSEYVFRFLQTDYTKGYFYCESSGVTRFGLGKHSVENLKLPVPPLGEQRLISRHLDKKTGQIDALIKKMQEKILLLSEYRQSLISSVVTGKVKLTEKI